MDRWKLNLLGGLCLEKDGVVVDQFPTRRAAMLLARLALSRNGAVGRDELAEEFWPEDYLDTTRLRLRQELKRLRTALGDGKELVDADRTWIRLDLENVEVDVREFEHLYTLIPSTEGERKAELLNRLCGLYKGPLLPELSEHWVFASRMDLKEKFESAISQYVAVLSSRGEYDRVVDTSLKGLVASPSNEAMVFALADAQIAQGDYTAAAKSIEDFERLVGSNAEIAAFKQRLSQYSPVETPALGAFIEAEQPNELPTYFDDFIGREKEFDIVWQLLNSEARCVSLIGPGGVGKTRLSTELATRARDRGRQVRFLSLDEVSGSHLQDRVADLVRPGASVLLVLDNAESDIDAAAQAVLKLLRSSTAQVLTTSRQRLGISGERAIELSPISTPIASESISDLIKNPAVELFLNRACAHSPEFRITESEIVDVIALMQRLEGLPLAIELAAAKAASVGIQNLANKLDTLFTMLVTKRRDVPERQRSLWATIDWSYQGLDDGSRQALEVLSLCPGGCGLEIAEAMLGDDAAELLDELRDRSLVVTNLTDDSRNRYRLLEPIREFVSSTINQEQRDKYLSRYGECLADRLNYLGKAFHGPNEIWAFTEKGREFDNIMMVMEWGMRHDVNLAVRLGMLSWRFWCHLGHRNEGHRMMVEVLEHPKITHSQDYALCCFGAGYTTYLLGKIDESDRWFKESLRVHRELGSFERANWVILNQTCVADEKGDFAEMLRLGKESLVGFEETGELLGLALANADISIAAAQMGDFEQARRHAEESFTCRLKLDSPVEIARGYFDKGRIAFEEGNLEDALQHLSEPLFEFDRSKQTSLQFSCYLTMVEAYIELADFDAARRTMGLAKQIEDRLGQVSDPGWFSRFNAMISMAEEKPQEAEKWIAESLQLSIRDQYERGQADSCIVAALVLATSGKEMESIEIHQGILARQRQGYGIRPSRERWLESLGATEPGAAVSWEALASKALHFAL